MVHMTSLKTILVMR